MWILRLALSRPYTFVVMAIIIALLGGTAIVTMPVDIFPYINIPIVSVLWQYGGLSPDEMEKRVVTNFERGLTSNVNDIEHIESQCFNSIAVVKIFFHPNVQIDMAVAQVTAQMTSAVRQMPPGMFPGNVLKFDAASVPVLQLGLSSKTLREQDIFDLGNNFIRTPLGTVQGANVSYPFGGKSRQVMVDLNLDELYAKQLSPVDVSNALNQQNLILPTGTAKLAETEYHIKVNSSPLALDDLNNLPIKTVNGAPIYMRDVAQVRDGFSVQNNIVRTNGNRGVLMTVTRTGKASTLDIVNGVQNELKKILTTLPPELKVTTLADQSVFVRASITGVEREALIAATLTGMMILLFLGSWRSTLIVCISIPLSILASLAILSLLGETINVMTLGGLALAVGILVDDATVAIENTHRNIAMGKPLVRAVLDAGAQIAIPTFVSTLAICIVFVPVLLLTGAARYLFTPLAMAVVFAMLASYLLSRTLVPTMANFLLKNEVEMYRHEGEEHAGSQGIFGRIHHLFNRGFESLRRRYVGLLDWSLSHRAGVLTAFMAFSVASLGLVGLVGEDFFPTVDSGQIKLHAQAPAGTRIEETERRFSLIERELRDVIPASEMDTIIDNIGIPNSWGSLAQGDIPTISSADGEILISLNKEKHSSTRDYEVKLRKILHEKFPDTVFFFQPANITSQILNFGLPAPIDLQVVGRDAEGNYKIAERLAEKIARIPGAVDVHVHQVVDQPEIRLDVDRVKAAELGLTQYSVTSNMLISLSGNGSVAPNFWVNWNNGVNYNVGIQTPQYKVSSLDALLRTPISAGGALNTTIGAGAGSATATNTSVGSSPSGASQAYGNPGAMSGNTQLLSNLVSVHRGYTPVIVNHYNVAPVFDVYANVARRDLGGVGSEVEKLVRNETPHMPRGVSLALRGQIETMRSSFLRLGLGMIFAVVLVYLLMTVNFQSWVDPFIILTALPGAMAGILWMLFVTGTTLSVPSLMGAIMCVGVATANSILMVTFANDQRVMTPSASEAMLAAGYARIRPVLMTATAMVLGMLPMSLGLGEGGEQNAPLGRAVIGGLAFATITTLFVVPIIYSYLRVKPPVDYDNQLIEAEREGAGK
ncbi:MAG TPA: efflux RND transporter permease subunit [Bryobacteraceae bacterium]|nr:efflux RND transporter permease subunit [Bryobacteraceae bacterium]